MSLAFSAIIFCCHNHSLLQANISPMDLCILEHSATIVPLVNETVLVKNYMILFTIVEVFSIRHGFPLEGTNEHSKINHNTLQCQYELHSGLE